jgi:hypothetical protein
VGLPEAAEGRAGRAARAHRARRRDDRRIAPRPKPKRTLCEFKAQEGDFYGGWITSDVEGPFKGGPGTRFW